MHDCPGGCGRQVRQRLYACKPCWYRLPYALRQPITDTYRRDAMAHLEAMQDAAEWYADNPLEMGR